MNELYAHFNTYYMNNDKRNNICNYTELTTSYIYSNERVRDAFWGFHMPKQVFVFHVDIKEMKPVKKIRCLLNNLDFFSVGHVVVTVFTSFIVVHDIVKLVELYKAL